jgi:hypothetical protein
MWDGQNWSDEVVCSVTSVPRVTVVLLLQFLITYWNKASIAIRTIWSHSSYSVTPSDMIAELKFVRLNGKIVSMSRLWSIKIFISMSSDQQKILFSYQIQHLISNCYELFISSVYYWLEYIISNKNFILAFLLLLS